MKNRNLPLHISFSRELRRNQTRTEQIMWDLLRDRKFLGLKFFRQHPFVINQLNTKTSFYVADFYCAKKNFVLEIDGLIHNFQMEYDLTRDEIFEEMGLTILRVTNDEVIKDPYAVLKKIREMLA